MTRAAKRKREHQQVNTTQQKYNKKMKEARPPKQNFKLHDYVALKINREDKANPLHPNVLLDRSN